MHVVIIGNGVSGTTVTTELRRQDKKIKITLISSENQYFFSRPALMYIYMREMTLENTQPYEKKFWKKNKINLIYDHVTRFDFDNNQIFLNEDTIQYDKLVLAVGAKGNLFGWPGQNSKGVQTFTNLSDLQKLEEQTKKYTKDNRVVVVGGGLIGIEVCEMMYKRHIPCTLLVREETYWRVALSPQEGNMVQKEIVDHGIDLCMQTELKEIKNNDSNEVTSIITNKDEEIACDTVVISAGVGPNIEQFKGTSLKIGRGILVDRKLKTNLRNVYACGDCTEIKSSISGKPNTIESLWYTGKMQAEVLAKNILSESEEEYNRGIWYNSAKFFTIDYHTYGLVNHNIPNEQELYYKDPTYSKSIRIIYVDDKVIGFNLLGVRYRHKVCEQWIKEKHSLKYVLDHLHEANFESEFFNKFEGEIRKWHRKKVF